MKRFKLLGIAAIVAVITIGLAGCPTDGGGNGGGGGSIDTAKLQGTWVNDNDPTITLRFGDVQNAGTPSEVIDFYYYKNGVPIYGGLPGIEGNIIGDGTHDFKAAFEGEKLKVSEATGKYEGIDGLYTKQ
jgi:hypothetical protein